MEYVVSEGKGYEQHVIQKIFIRKILSKDRIARPVKIVARAVLADKFGHPYMQVSVGIEDGGDRELRGDYNNDAEKEGAG